MHGLRFLLGYNSSKNVKGKCEKTTNSTITSQLLHKCEKTTNSTITSITWYVEKFAININ